MIMKISLTQKYYHCFFSRFILDTNYNKTDSLTLVFHETAFMQMA